MQPGRDTHLEEAADGPEEGGAGRAWCRGGLRHRIGCMLMCCCSAALQQGDQLCQLRSSAQEAVRQPGLQLVGAACCKVLPASGTRECSHRLTSAALIIAWQGPQCLT